MISVSIAELLPLAAGVAIAPTQIIAMIALLLAANARRNGTAFAAGWLVGLFGLSTVLTFLVDAGDGAAGESGGGPGIGAWIKVVIGLAMLYLAFRTWRNRREADEPQDEPAWMTRLDELSPFRSFRLGLLLVVVDPLNLLMCAGVASLVGAAGLGGTEILAVLVVFTILGSVTIVGPILYFLVRGAAIEPTLAEIRGWMTANQTAVSMTVLILLGFVLLSDGIEAIAL